MVLTYKNAGGWGAGKGAALTSLEADNNIYDLDGRVTAMETTPTPGNGITNITASGDQMTITLQDATQYQVTIPTALMRWTGDFQAATAYYALDLLTDVNTGVYIVLQDHTSASTFDAGASNTAGPYYQLVFALGIVDIFGVTTTTYTPDATKAENWIRCSNASGCTVTIPLDSTTDFGIGTSITFEATMASTAAVTIVGESDSVASVTLRYPPSKNPTTAEQFATITAIKVAANEWVLTGYFEPVTV